MRVAEIKSPYGLETEFVDKPAAQAYLLENGFVRDPYYTHVWLNESTDTYAYLHRVREFNAPDTYLAVYDNPKIERLRSADKLPKKMGLRLVAKLREIGADYAQ